MRARPPSPPGWLNAHEIAEACGITYDSYRHWRIKGKGPKTFRRGRHVYATEEEVARWRAQQELGADEFNPEMRPPEPKLSRRPPRHDAGLKSAA